MFLASEDKFPVVMTDNVISDQVIMPLTNAVWYISGNMGTIQERSKHLPNVQGIPARYLNIKFTVKTPRFILISEYIDEY